jgi:hypothetical protein
MIFAFDSCSDGWLGNKNGIHTSLVKKKKKKNYF